MRINIQIRETIESSIVNGSGVLSGVLTNLKPDRPTEKINPSTGEVRRDN